MPKVNIDNAFFGVITINGQKHETDLTVYWDGEILQRDRRHNLTKSDIDELLLKEPEVIVIGTGNSGLMKVDTAAEVSAKIHGVEVVSKATPLAAQEFNKFMRLKKRVVAVMHATC